MNEDRKASEYVSGSRRLRPEEIAFEDEMLIIGNRLNFYMPLYFDPVEVFGEKMRLEDGEGYINVYANYDLDNECVCDTLEIVKVLYNDEEWNGYYLLSAEEKAAIQRKMEQYHHGANTLQTVLKDYAEEKGSVLGQLAKAKAAAPPFFLQKLCAGIVSGGEKLKEYGDYDVLEFGDSLIPGVRLKIEHQVGCENADISDLITQPIADLQAMREESASSEQTAYQVVLAAVHQWEKQAAVTQRLDRAMQYLKLPVAQHTGNQWVTEDDGSNTISNMVYKMTYSLVDNSNFNWWKSNGIKVCWSVKWRLYTNSPLRHGVMRVAGQDRTFEDKAAAERYLNGRIKAYAHLFTELSPPIPKAQIECFRVNNRLLPGYREEPVEIPCAEDPAADSASSKQKASVLEQLSTTKEQEKQKPKESVSKPAAYEIE